MAEQPRRGDAYEAVLARLDQLVALVQTRLIDRLDQLAGALARVQTQLTELEERLAQLRADLAEGAIWPIEEGEEEAPADSTAPPEAP